MKIELDIPAKPKFFLIISGKTTPRLSGVGLHPKISLKKIQTLKKESANANAKIQ